MAYTTDRTEKRLARLVAAVLWYDEEYYADIYDLHFAEADESCPDVGLVELTEGGYVEIFAEGREYVLRVEPKPR